MSRSNRISNSDWALSLRIACLSYENVFMPTRIRMHSGIPFNATVKLVPIKSCDRDCLWL